MGGAAARSAEPQRPHGDAGDAWERLAACATTSSSAAWGCVLRLDGSTPVVAACSGGSSEALPAPGVPVDDGWPAASLVGAAIRSRSACVQGSDSAPGNHRRAAVCVPVVHDDVVIAALYVEADRGLQPGSLPRLESLAGFAAAALGAVTGRESLERSDGQLRALCDHSDALMFVKDLQGRYTYVNRRFAEAFHRERSDLIGRTAHDLVSRETADEIRATDQRAQAEDRELEIEEPLVQDDGLHEYHTVKFPLHGERGQVVALGTIAVDVTADKRSEEALCRSVSLLEATLESTADGVLVVDVNGRIERMNRRFMEMWRLPPELLEERDDAKALSYVLDQLTDPDQFLSKVKELYLAREASSYDTLRFQDGRVFERFSQPQRLADEVVGRVWSFRDVTARVRAEAERDRLLADEQRARREAEAALRARDEFLSVASHELRTPMTSLLLALNAIDRCRVCDAPGAQRAITIALRQVRRLEGLVELLLDVSRISGGQLELDRKETDLSALVEEVGKSLTEELARSGTSLNVHAPAPVVGWWDPSRLHQALLNLLTNAAKFGERQPIDVRVWSEGPTAFVSVQDQGIGVPVEVQATLFEPFQRGVSARSYGGLGLGLFVTRAIVEAHGGRVELASSPGAGAKFVIELPLSPGAGPEGAGAHPGPA